jgi:hypothetical protein
MTSGELFRFVLFWIASPKARNDGVGGREILNKLLRKQNHDFAPAHSICRLRPERIELVKLYFRLPLGVSPRKAEPLKSRNFTGAE